MKIILALLFVLSLVFSPLAMAGDLTSSDSDFLFKDNKIASKTISSKEMKETQAKGQLLHISGNLNGNKVLSGNGNKILSGNKLKL